MLKNRFAHSLPFGASFARMATRGFRLWAPSVESLTLEVDGDDPRPMRATGGGWYETDIRVPAGARYRYRLPDGLAVPDPASRLQHGDVHG